MPLSILIVRTSAIGDVVQTLPVLEYLRCRFPDAIIDWVVEKPISPALRINLLNTVIPIESKKWRSGSSLVQAFRALRQRKYDLVFDLQGNIKSGLITLLARGKCKVGFGWKSVREKPNVLATSHRFEVPLHLNVRERYLQLVRLYFQDEVAHHPLTFAPCIPELTEEETQRLNDIIGQPFMQSDRILMIAAFSRWKNKTIPESLLLDLVQGAPQFQQMGFVIVFGNADEEQVARRIEAALPGQSGVIGGLSLPLWQALIRRVDGIVAVDSAALHFAGSVQTPSFSFFGPTRSEIFKPPGIIHQGYQGSCPYHQVFEKQCPRLRDCPTGACLSQLHSEQVRLAFNQWILALAIKKREGAVKLPSF